MPKVINDLLKSVMPPIRCSEKQLLNWQKLARRRGDNLSRMIRAYLDAEYRKEFEDQDK